MIEEIILIGGGGHCRSVLDSIKQLNKYNIVGILDVKENVGTYIDDIKIIGTDDDWEKLYLEGIKYAFISIGSIKSSALREKIYYNLKRIGFKMPIIIDPSTILSSNTKIGEGSFVGKGAIINANTTIGHSCIINSGSIIEHECNIGSLSHIAPGAVLCGGVSIGNKTFIGANSIVIQGRKIGDSAVIGAGSVVIGNINSGSVAYGNPCREVKL